MYQAIETDNLILKQIEVLDDGNTNTRLKNNNSFINSKLTLMYVIYFIISCLLLLVTWSMIYYKNGNESELTLQGSYYRCVDQQRRTGNTFALYKTGTDITIHGFWPDSLAPDNDCYNCASDVINSYANIGTCKYRYIYIYINHIVYV